MTQRFAFPASGHFFVQLKQVMASSLDASLRASANGPIAFGGMSSSRRLRSHPMPSLRQSFGSIRCRMKASKSAPTTHCEPLSAFTAASHTLKYVGNFTELQGVRQAVNLLSDCPETGIDKSFAPLGRGCA